MPATVRSVMTSDAVSVRVYTPYKQIVRILLDYGISAVPVVDEAGHVLGVVSQADLIEKEAAQARSTSTAAHRPVTWHSRTSHTKAHAVSADTLMTGPAITISPDADLNSAALLMSKHNVKRLPVVDGEGRLLGVVSRGDLLVPYLRSDIEIHDEILNRVLLSEMCVDPHSIDVKIADGVVTLSGRMENEFVARDTAARVRAIDGVIEVVDYLTPEPGEDQPQRLPFRTPVY
jgi:CBS domain-containing protein